MKSEFSEFSYGFAVTHGLLKPESTEGHRWTA